MKLAWRMLHSAMTGDLSAIKELLDRAEGNAVPAVDPLAGIAEKLADGLRRAIAYVDPDDRAGMPDGQAVAE